MKALREFIKDVIGGGGDKPEARFYVMLRTRKAAEQAGERWDYAPFQEVALGVVKAIDPADAFSQEPRADVAIDEATGKAYGVPPKIEFK